MCSIVLHNRSVRKAPPPGGAVDRATYQPTAEESRAPLKAPGFIWTTSMYLEGCHFTMKRHPKRRPARGFRQLPNQIAGGILSSGVRQRLSSATPVRMLINGSSMPVHPALRIGAAFVNWLENK
jgi:hypothetical protein